MFEFKGTGSKVVELARWDEGTFGLAIRNDDTGRTIVTRLSNTDALDLAAAILASAGLGAVIQTGELRGEDSTFTPDGNGRSISGFVSKNLPQTTVYRPSAAAPVPQTSTTPDAYFVAAEQVWRCGSTSIPDHLAKEGHLRDTIERREKDAAERRAILAAIQERKRAADIEREREVTALVAAMGGESKVIGARGVAERLYDSGARVI